MIAEIGEDLLLVLQPHEVVGVIVVPLHLVENNAGDAHAALAVRLKMPRLLLEDASVLKEQGVKHGVEIDRHEIHVVPLVSRDKVVDGLILIGHGVEIHRHRGFDEVDKGLLKGVVRRAVKAGVLQNMEHAGIVLRQCAEAHRKDHLPVITIGVVQRRAGDLMDQLGIVCI